jgi:hypothetical protein
MQLPGKFSGCSGGQGRADPRSEVSCPQHRDDGKLLAASKTMQAPRQSAVELQQKLKIVLLRGRKTEELPSRVMQKNFEWLLWRILFAEKHTCVSNVETSLACAKAAAHVCMQLQSVAHDCRGAGRLQTHALPGVIPV